MWRFIILCVLGSASAFAHATPAWALEPNTVDAVSPLWTAQDLGRGKTLYSQGLSTTTEVTPQGPSSYRFDTWSPDRMNTVGTIYSPVNSHQPVPAPAILPSPQNSRSVRQP